MDINPIYSVKPPVSIPGYSVSGYNKQWVSNYMQSLVNQGSNLSGVSNYIHGATVASSLAYAGGIYSPTQNRIYFVPFAQAAPANVSWHYIDCNTGNIVAYTNPGNAVSGAYVGGAFVPSQNRIYFAPNAQASSANAVWHYIDCSLPDSTMVGTIANPTFATAFAASNAYIGGVLSPTQKRIYLVPANQADITNGLCASWHYIDCSTSTGVITTYANPGGAQALAYANGAYSPTENRIYFVPHNCPLPNLLQYVDCNVSSGTGMIKTYANPGDIVATAYYGGIYSPTQNRIYFAPRSQALPNSSTTRNWHYVDCNTGTIGTYLNPNTAVDLAYRSGAYSPTQNRIYFSPRQQGPQALWHYIDCNTGLVGTYTNSFTTMQNNSYLGAVYSPTQNRVYFIPYFGAAPQLTWHFLDMQSNANTSKIMMSAAEYNKL